MVISQVSGPSIYRKYFGCYTAFKVISTTTKVMSVLSTKGVTVVLGAQWGDEGKGKLSDILCGEAEICARCQVNTTLISY
jgi:hypothetical protein